MRQGPNLVSARVIGVLLALVPIVAGAKPRWRTCPLPPAMPTPVAHGRVAVNGAHIYYATFGEAQAAPVILLHGGLGTSDHWSNQVPALIEADFRVIAIDSRGHGRSTRTRAPATYSRMATDVVAVMDELKVAQAAVVGWSDGGEVALKLAIEHPDRIAKLVVFGANFDGSGRKPRTSSATFRAYTAKCRADYQRLSNTPTQFGALVQWMLPAWRGSMGITPARLQTISAPTMIIGADHDELITLEHFAAMAARIPNGTLTTLSDASHFAPWQAPTEFNTVLVDFLQR